MISVSLIGQVRSECANCTMFECTMHRLTYICSSHLVKQRQCKQQHVSITYGEIRIVVIQKFYSDTNSHKVLSTVLILNLGNVCGTRLYNRFNLQRTKSAEITTLGIVMRICRPYPLQKGPTRRRPFPKKF